MAAPPLAQDGAPATGDDNSFKVPWTSEQIGSLKAKGGFGQLPLNRFARWTTPGLDQAEFEAILDEVGVPQAETDRRELRTLWDAHRSRMIALHASTARAMWETAERMGPEWERDPWSKAMIALSASQGRRMADAQLASIDDARGLLSEVVSRAPVDRTEVADFVAARTVDRLLREDELVSTDRAGGARADLWRLVTRASRELSAAQLALIRPVLRLLYEQTHGARRELVREGNRTGAINYYIRVPDERRLREVRAELASPGTGQQLGLIRDAVQRTVDALEAIVGPESAARLRALLDAEASSPPGTPAAAFPDREQGELTCRLLSLDPPALPADQSELLKAIQQSSCIELATINAELRSNEWTEALLRATWTDDPSQHAKLLDRRRELLSERTRVNGDLRQLLRAALDDSTLRDLERRLN